MWHAALEFGVWFAVQEVALRRPQKMHAGAEGKEHLCCDPVEILWEGRRWH